MANGNNRAPLSAIAETPIETYVDALLHWQSESGHQTSIWSRKMMRSVCACVWMDCYTVSPVPLVRLLTSYVLASR